MSTEYNTQLLINTSGILENPPVAVLQTARVLARKNDLTYDFSLDTLGDYYIVLYFAGILPVSSLFNIVINGEVMSTNFTVKNSEASVIFFVKSGIKTLNITLQNVSFYPQVSAIEVYELVDIPLESSSTTGILRNMLTFFSFIESELSSNCVIIHIIFILSFYT